MTMVRSILVLISLTLFIDGAWADEPPPPADLTKKSGQWNRALLEPGRGWWCSKLECSRGLPTCEVGGFTCKQQRHAWGFSYFFWDTTSQADVPGMWNARLFPSRAHCDEMRRLLLVDDESGDVGEFTNVSPCTRAGDRPLDELPPGRGWWCTRARSVALNIETSLCSRVRVECVAGTAELGSAKVTNAVGALEVVRACRRSATAWAAKVSFPTPKLKVFETEADCAAVALGATCHKVK